MSNVPFLQNIFLKSAYELNSLNKNIKSNKTWIPNFCSMSMHYDCMNMCLIDKLTSWLTQWGYSEVCRSSIFSVGVFDSSAAPSSMKQTKWKRWKALSSFSWVYTQAADLYTERWDSCCGNAGLWGGRKLWNETMKRSVSHSKTPTSENKPGGRCTIMTARETHISQRMHKHILVSPSVDVNSVLGMYVGLSYI